MTGVCWQVLQLELPYSPQKNQRFLLLDDDKMCSSPWRKKAFDSVPLKLPLSTLPPLNNPSHLLCWLLLPHNSFTKGYYHWFSSSPCHASSGVPLGFIFSPLHVIININDISKVTLSSSSSLQSSTLILYANDTLPSVLLPTLTQYSLTFH